MRLDCGIIKLALVALAVSGCGDGRGRSAPPIAFDGSVLRFDAAMLARDDAGARADAGAGAPLDAGPLDAGRFDAGAVDAGAVAIADAGSDAGVSLPPAVLSPDGVLTPYPRIRYRATSPSFEIVTANFEEITVRGSVILVLYVELRSHRTTPACNFIPSVFLDSHEFTCHVVSSPYYEESYPGATLSPVADDCIPPGGIGVLTGDSLLGAAALAAAVELTVDPNPTLPSAIQHPALDAPMLTTALGTTADGWVVRGSLTPQRLIYNYNLEVFARDDRGVLFANIVAFPLGELPASVPIAYETDAAPRAFTEYLAYQGWINR